MATLNYAFKELSCKIVYYGCGLCGKTTNLIHIHKTVPTKFRGDLVSLATEQDRTLFFDFLPLDLGEVKGFKTKFQLYTVPGQVYYNATRKLVLRGVDGLVFVADSQKDRMQENLESLENLKQNLEEYGYHLQNGDDDQDGIPWCLQYNKRDMPQVATVEELEKLLNFAGMPTFEAVAVTGQGVKETLKGISSFVIKKLNKEGTTVSVPKSAGGAKPPTAPTPAAKPVTPPPMANDEFEPMGEEEDDDTAPPPTPAKKSAPPSKPPQKPTARHPEPKPSQPIRSDIHDQATMIAGGRELAAAAQAAAGPPTLNVTQRCDARWRGMRTGGGSLTLSNLPGGSGEYQLTGMLSFLGLFKQTWSKRLAYKGRQPKIYENVEGMFHEFASAPGQEGPALTIYVKDSLEKSLFVSYLGAGGDIIVTPEGKTTVP